MAHKPVDQTEFAGRLAILLRHAGMRANALSKAIDKKPGYISWLQTDARHVPTELIVPIAHALAGQGNLKNLPDEIGKYLIGLRGWDDSPDLTISEPLLTDLVAA